MTKEIVKRLKCDKCNKDFDRKSNYLNHINRKNKCDKDVNVGAKEASTIQGGSGLYLQHIRIRFILYAR